MVARFGPRRKMKRFAAWDLKVRVPEHENGTTVPASCITGKPL